MSEEQQSGISKPYFTSLIMSLFLCGTSLAIIESESTIPLIGIKAKPAYFLPVLALITLSAYVYYLKMEGIILCKKVDKFSIGKGFVFLTLINGLSMFCFVNFYCPLHMMLEVLFWGLVGLGIGSSLDMTIGGIFCVRSDKEMVEKWLPRVPFAVLCQWQAALRLPYIIIIIFLIALNYHFYLFPYHRIWSISFFVTLLFSMQDTILFLIAIIFNIRKLKEYAVRNFKLLLPVMEIHDRDYLLFGHQKTPILANQPEIIRASYKGDIDTISALLKQGERPDTQDAIGWTPLMVAAAENHIDIVNLMLEYGANVNIENTWGRTALHFASRYGFTDIVTTLVKNGAIVNANNDHSRQPPLFSAIKHNHKDVVQVLLEHGADMESKNGENLTPLKYAEKLRKSEIAKILRIQLIKNEQPKPYTFLDSLLKK